MRRPFIVPALLVSILLVQCTPTQVKPKATTPPISPTSTMSPTTESSFGPWELVWQTEANGSVYVAGFHDDDFGITVGYGGDVRYTTDSGHLWTRAENKSFCRFGLDIVDEKTAWHCGNGGHIRVSTDGGQTWQAVTSFGPNHPDHCRFLSFLDVKTGWAATPHQIGLTVDGAETWTEVPLPESIQDIAAISLHTVIDGYVLDSTGTLFVTRDGGQSWSSHSLGLEEGHRLVTSSAPTAVLRFLDANQGVAVFQDSQRIWYARTTDGGQTWQREEIPMNIVRPTLYLAHDGKTLTMFSGSKIIVLRYNDA